MIKAGDLEFNYNDAKILHVGTHKPGQSLKRVVEEGNSVSLRKANIKIEVQNIKKTEKGAYFGTVQYVEPYQALSKDGIDEGVDIYFLYKHIFACRH